MFRGSSAISLDSKGRMAVPARYRSTLEHLCDGHLVCTIDLKDKCLLLYPLPEWEAVEVRLRELSKLNSAHQRMQRILVGYAHECELDKGGRLLLPQSLRQYANLQKQITLLGQLNKFEIWDEAAWQQQAAADQAALQEDLAALQNDLNSENSGLANFSY